MPKAQQRPRLLLEAYASLPHFIFTTIVMAESCSFFKKGKCKFGEKCKYLHSVETVRHTPFGSAKSPSPNGPETIPSQDNPRKRTKTFESQSQIICRYWKTGSCTYGDHCKFKHERPAEQINKSQATDGGNGSHFPADDVHPEQNLEPEKQPLAKTEDQWMADASATTQHIVLGSTLITCAAGLQIRDVISGFESCLVIVKGIPADATRSDIQALSLQQGLDSRDFCITQVVVDHETSQGTKLLEVTILLRAQSARAFSNALNGLLFRRQRLTSFIKDNNASNAMGESTTENSRVLSITWPSSSIRMVATYASMEEAQRKVVELKDRLFRNRKVVVKMNEPPKRRPSGYCASSIVIMDLLVDTSPEDVAGFAGTASVKLLKSPTYHRDDVIKALRIHLQSIPESRSMQSFEVSPTTEADGKTTVRATFESWDHANRARASLEGKKLRPHFSKFWLSLPDPVQFTTSMPIRQYRAEKRIWDELAAPDGARVQIRVKGDQRAVVRISGDNKKAVGLLKVKVETLMAGQSLGPAYWHRFFGSSAGRAFLDKVGTDTETFVRIYWRTRTLRLYGRQASKDAAQKRIMAEIERLSRSEFTVQLKRHMVAYFMRKGLTALHEILGEDAVTVNLTTIPSTITIRGTEAARSALASLLNESNADAAITEHSETGDLCAICYSGVSNPVQLGCGHVYCFSCIRHYIVSAIETKKFPLACMGNEDTCKAPIAIPVIQRFLSPQQFDHLVQVAFSDYLDKHPNDFRYCPTPDCSQVYRCVKDTSLKCPSCFVEVCANCHEEAHEGMTCDEMRIYRDPEEQERLNDEWAAGKGAKKCPSCHVWIEKTEGCNHMTCRCGAHICWKCMQTFDPGVIYTHLHDAHGGAFDDPEPRNAAAVHPNMAPMRYDYLFREEEEEALLARVEATRLVRYRHEMLLRDQAARPQAQAQDNGWGGCRIM